MDQRQLQKLLTNLDGKGYKSYKELKGTYEFPHFKLIFDHIQGDPFAAASKLRIQLLHSITNYPQDYYSSSSRRIALEDYLTRRFFTESNTLSRIRGTGKSGLISIDKPGQQILERTSCLIRENAIELRFVVGLPANGRTILGLEASHMLCIDLPKIISQGILYANQSDDDIFNHITTNEDADHIRQQLASQKLIAFIADGSFLPRLSGVDDKPLTKGSVAFRSDPHYKVEFTCPNRGKISGMGFPKGITLIVGGGYHGKSTVLKSLEAGVYNHIPGDGREMVVTDAMAVKIKAEEGRSIQSVGISPFINNLPFGRPTHSFSTTNASGSTSQAANIIEAIETKASVLLLDEDTSATNFMIRDRRMQALINKTKEPITPFSDKIKSLYQDYSISTILVMGGCGDYFEIADHIIAMDEYQPKDVTNDAHSIAQKLSTGRLNEGGQEFGKIGSRILGVNGFSAKNRNRDPYIRIRETDEIFFGINAIDMSSVDQLVHESQLRSIGTAMHYARQKLIDEKKSVVEICEEIFLLIEEKGLDSIQSLPDGDLAAFRLSELAAAINRLRPLTIIDGENE